MGNVLGRIAGLVLAFGIFGEASAGSITYDILDMPADQNGFAVSGTITTDGVSQRKAIDRVYAQIASGSAAQTFVSDYYRGDPPFKRAETETVSVEVKSILPTSDRTYEVEWVETTRDLYGSVKATDRWIGYFGIALNPPKDERQARINPLGVYVTSATWAKVL